MERSEDLPKGEERMGGVERGRESSHNTRKSVAQGEDQGLLFFSEVGKSEESVLEVFCRSLYTTQIKARKRCQLSALSLRELEKRKTSELNVSSLTHVRRDMMDP